MKRTAVLASLALMGFAPACHPKSDNQPGAVTSDEAAQLNDAAAMLEANSVDADRIDPATNESTANDQ